MTHPTIFMNGIHVNVPQYTKGYRINLLEGVTAEGGDLRVLDKLSTQELGDYEVRYRSVSDSGDETIATRIYTIVKYMNNDDYDMGDIEYLSAQEYRGRIIRRPFFSSYRMSGGVRHVSTRVDYEVPFGKEAYIMSVSAQPTRTNGRTHVEVQIRVNSIMIDNFPILDGTQYSNGVDAFGRLNRDGVRATPFTSAVTHAVGVVGRKLREGDSLSILFSTDPRLFYDQHTAQFAGQLTLLQVDVGESPSLLDEPLPPDAPKITIDSSEIEVMQHHPVNLLDGVRAPDGYTITTSPTSLDTSTLRTMYVEYFARNEDGDELVSRRRRYNVISDVSPPVINVSPDMITVERATAPPNLLKGVTLGDGEPTTTTLVASGEVDVNSVDRYTITYTATDLSGNTTTATRTYRVIDTTPPIITVEPNRVQFQRNEELTLDEALDGVIVNEGELTASLSNVDTSQPIGTSFVVTYTATDESGNTSTATRTYTLVPNRRPVVIVSPNRVVTELQVGGNSLTYDDLLEGVRVDNSTAEAIPFIEIFINGVDLRYEYTQLEPDYGEMITQPTVINIVYRATNTEGQRGEARRTYQFIDTTPPVISLIPPIVEVPKNVNLVNLLDGVSTTDNDSRPARIEYTPQNISFDSLAETEITYTATDPSGNRSTPRVRTYRILDRVEPVIVVNPRTVFFFADLPRPNLLDGVSATDDSGESIEVMVEGNKTLGTNYNGRITIITYIARDRAGNTARAVRRYRSIVAPSPHNRRIANVSGERSNDHTMYNFRFNHPTSHFNVLDQRVVGYQISLRYQASNGQGFVIIYYARRVIDPRTGEIKRSLRGSIPYNRPTSEFRNISVDTLTSFPGNAGPFTELT